MNWYVCKEFDEIFWVEAENDNDAMEKASLYNGVVVRKLTEDEISEFYKRNTTMTLDQICESIAITSRHVTTAKLMRLHEETEQYLREMHELAWQLVEASRPKDDEL